MFGVGGFCEKVDVLTDVIALPFVGPGELMGARWYPAAVGVAGGHLGQGLKQAGAGCCAVPLVCQQCISVVIVLRCDCRGWLV
jgi:hypothetical protein